MPEEMTDGGRKLVTLDDLIDALDKRERASSNVPKVETFHFKGDRVSDWLDLTEQALVGLSDEVKLQRVLRKEVVEVEEEEDEGDDEEDEKLRQEEDQRVEQRAKKRGAQGGAESSLHDGVPKRKKYAVRLEEGFDVERMVDKLLEGHNDLMNLKDILASAPRLRGELKGRLSRRLVPNVHLSSILPREIEWTESGTRMDWKCVACGLVKLKVRDQPSIAMVDTGAEMNIIREWDATMLGLEVDHSDHGMLHGVNCKAIFCGTASNVMVEIGRVRARTCFFVMPDVDHPILLGRSFLCRTETLVFNRHEGTMILALSDPACGNYEIIKCRNTGPGSGRNRLNLDSFTFEEFEYVRRRLREEQEEEGAGEVLSLSLNDVNKAMEVVAAHDMADLEAIKALREQVLESPQDLQRLNAVTVRDTGGLPNANTLSESCAGRPIISLIDLYSGYDQFPVYPPDRPVTAMHTPRLIHMNVAPQGWTNAVAMVQRHMIRAMQTVSPHITQPYIDNLAVKGPKEKEEDEVMPGVRRFVWKHVQDLDQVLGLLEEHNLTASDVKKTDKILEWSVPFQSITDVRSFLGTCGFWRSFVKDFATKTEHLRKLVRQDQEWVWGEDQENVVGRMNREFKEGGLVLGAPNYEATEEKPFVVETDVGPTALGGVLIQADADGKEWPLRSDFSKAVMQRGGRDTRPRQGPQRMEGRGEQHEPHRREPAPEFDDDNIELFLDVYRDHAAQRGWSLEGHRAVRGASPEPAQRSWPEGIPGPGSEEIPEFPPEAATIPEQEAEAEDQGLCERARMEAPLDLPSATQATKSPDIEEPVSAELPPVVPRASTRMEAEASTPGDQEPRMGGTPRETREEKSARMRVRLDEIYARQTDMEAAGIEPTPPVEPKTSEQRIDELWARYESQRDAARQRLREAGQADEEMSELREMGDLGFSTTRQAIGRMDRRVCETAVTTFQWYNLLSNELRVKELEVEHLTTQLAEERVRSRAREVEWERRFGEMAAAVGRLSAAWEASRMGRAGADSQGRGVQASQGQGASVEVLRQAEPMEEAPLDAVEEESGAQESLMAMSTEKRGSRLHELAAAMGIGTPQEGPQGLNAHAPRLGELRAELGSWATGTDSGGPDSQRQQQQEVMSEPAAMGGSQPSGVCKDEAMMT
ncbi:hypothetical protein CBR_g34601 [Chara braunii]|uniref:Reverse transcriptase domain-containing protein n=1 Tax=Chara braunii TaxID=69332 RepID=A0A388LJ69_CHABU|nr:hypothetical protein CBR_g34601 [Chara braunii]|eukprot:GBG82317.1 hypothetical protein CBR_g34601 [Chara braunii]